MSICQSFIVILVQKDLLGANSKTHAQSRHFIGGNGYIIFDRLDAKRMFSCRTVDS